MLDAVFFKQPGFAVASSGEAGIDAKQYIGLAAGTLQLDTVQGGDGICNGYPLKLATCRYASKRRLDLRARTPVGNKAVIGVDGQLVLGRCRQGKSDKSGK